MVLVGRANSGPCRVVYQSRIALVAKLSGRRRFLLPVAENGELRLREQGNEFGIRYMKILL